MSAAGIDVLRIVHARLVPLARFSFLTRADETTSFSHIIAHVHGAGITDDELRTWIDSIDIDCEGVFEVVSMLIDMYAEIKRNGFETAVTSITPQEVDTLMAHCLGTYNANRMNSEKVDIDR